MAALRRKTQKPLGVVYTPAPIVRRILQLTLERFLADADGARLRRLRVLDPACGDGAFLGEVYRRLLHFQGARAAPARLEALRQHIFGVDIDPAAVEQTRRRLAAAVLGVDGPSPWSEATKTEVEGIASALHANLCCEDSLLRETDAFLQPGEFDVIVANPPFIGARRIAQARDASIKTLFQSRYRCVHGSCDLYVLFLERIGELLADGGRFGVVAPNKLAVADYARPCRDYLLREMRLEQIDDISDLPAFPGVNVYPMILCGAKASAPRDHRVTLSRPASLDDLSDGPSWTVAQSELDAARGFPLRPALDLETRAPTRPLGEIATLHSGTTGFAAQQLASALVERSEGTGDAWDFITTGNIDRYRVRRGDVRFLRRTYCKPVLPREAAFLSDQKRRLYSEPKIVLAGMCLRPEAAWEAGGLALGVQVYAAAQCREDAFYLLAVLNSKLFAYLFRARLQAKRMAAGYLAVNKGQLARLPIRTIEGPHARRCRDDAAEAAWRLTRINGGVLGGKGDCERMRDSWERRVDEMVYQLYGLRDPEIAMIEREMAEES